MGEGAEQMPLAVIEDAPFIQFRKENPSRAELADLRVGIREDLYAPLLAGAKWKKGRGGK
jgi:F420-0:gamma-glutamyl ligase